MKLRAALPVFYAELERGLRDAALTALLAQLPELEILDRCGCDESGCATFRVKPSRDLNAIEQNVIGVRYGSSYPVNAIAGMVVLDTDNFGRVVGIEVLDRPDVAKELDQLHRPKSSGRTSGCS
jgi:Protein of unknown function (DUF2283)